MFVAIPALPPATVTVAHLAPHKIVMAQVGVHLIAMKTTVPATFRTVYPVHILAAANRADGDFVGAVVSVIVMWCTHHSLHGGTIGPHQRPM